MYNNISHLYNSIDKLYKTSASQQQQIRELYEIIHQLYKSIDDLKTEIREIKEKPATNIERVEYKFDQLKVETLEGTLNIGLTPNVNSSGDTSSIEDFSVDQKQLAIKDSNKNNSGLYKSIKQNIHQFLDKDSYKLMQSLEEQYQMPLNQQYRDFIIGDIRKQIDDRILHYLNQRGLDIPPKQLKAVEQEIIKKVKDDITNTIDAFIRNMPNTGGS